MTYEVCKSCKGITLDENGTSPYVDGGIYCDCEDNPHMATVELKEVVKLNLQK